MILDEFRIVLSAMVVVAWQQFRTELFSVIVAAQFLSGAGCVGFFAVTIIGYCIEVSMIFCKRVELPIVLSLIYL